MANPKLNQVIAIEESTKKREYADLTRAHQAFQKDALFNGFVRTYQPRFEDGVKYPDEKNVVQKNGPQLLKQVIGHQAELFNIVATKDVGNTAAKADVTVDGKVLVADAPVTFLIFLEKRLVDLRTFVSKLPALDPAKEWTYDAARAMYSTPPEQKLKTRKVHKAIVKYEATKEHPAQTELVTVDEPEGTWVQTDLSTAFPADKIRELLERIDVLEKAVKTAREQANGIEVMRQKAGDAVLGYLFP